MNRTADFVVIGGGIFGAGTAHFLSKTGFGQGVLLEQRSLAAVSTGHSAAHVRTYYSNPVTVQLAGRAVEMFENGAEELGGDCTFRQIGFLMLLDSDAQGPAEHVIELQRRCGIDVQQVSREEIHDLAPPLDLCGVTNAIYEPKSGYADPRKTTQNLVEAAQPWGLEVREGTAACGIRKQGDRVVGVETQDGLIETPVVVNAAGAWGRQVGGWVGRNDSLRWSRETDLKVRLPHDFPPIPVISDTTLRNYFRTDGEGNLLAGLGAPKEIEPLDIGQYDAKLDDASRRRIEEGLFQRLPMLRQAPLVDGWASIYTITDDWHPLVGPEPGLEGYYSCYGGSGHCFKLGPPIGEALAAIIAGRAPEIDITPLRPTRFIEGAPLTSAWGDGNRA